MQFKSNEEVKRDNSRWHVLLATWLGLMFDGMDATIFVLVIYPSLSELLNTTSHADIGNYGGIILAVFMVGWALGSIVFGTLSDHIGRTKTMIITMIIYAVCTGLCATSHSWIELAIYRFFVGCGIGGEQSIGVVLISESWSGKARLHATGWMTTAFGFGYLFAGILNLLLGNFGWRLLFIAGVAPALVTLYIRWKLKEPEDYLRVSEQKKRLKSKDQTTLSASEKELLIPTYKRIFDNKHLKKSLVVTALASTAIVGYWSVLAWIPPWINQITGTMAVAERSTTTIIMNIGAILSCIFTGWLVMKVGRANTFRIAFLGALTSLVCMFLLIKSYGITLWILAFIVGIFTQLPFTSLFIYVPELFETNIRGTAFGFSVQIGRLMGAVGALTSGHLIAVFNGSYAMAGSCLAAFYLVGFATTFIMPASKGEVSKAT